MKGIILLGLLFVIGCHGMREYVRDDGVLIRRTPAREMLRRGLDRSARSCRCQCRRKWNNYWDCCKCLDGCFPATTTVTLESGQTVTMADLRPGDHVRSVDENGAIVWSEVRAFMKRQPSQMGEYLKLTTEGGQVLSLSPSHVVFASETNVTSSGSRYAKDVKLGHYVFTLDAKDQGLIPVKVTKIESHFMQGVYVPLTWHGTLLANDIFTSCYAAFDHKVAHFFMAPMRYLPTVFDISWESEEPRWYCEIMRKIGHLILPASEGKTGLVNSGVEALSALLKTAVGFTTDILSLNF